MLSWKSSHLRESFSDIFYCLPITLTLIPVVYLSSWGENRVIKMTWNSICTQEARFHSFRIQISTRDGVYVILLLQASLEGTWLPQSLHSLIKYYLHKSDLYLQLLASCGESRWLGRPNQRTEPLPLLWKSSDETLTSPLNKPLTLIFRLWLCNTTFQGTSWVKWLRKELIPNPTTDLHRH